MLLEHRLSALLQLHLHSRLNIWLQWIRQRQLQDEKRSIYVLWFGASYIRDFMVFTSYHLSSGSARSIVLYPLAYCCSIFFSYYDDDIKGNISAVLAICAGNSPAIGEFPTQRPVPWSFDVFFDLRLNKQLSKLSWGWWFETPSRSLCHHCNALLNPQLLWINRQKYRDKCVKQRCRILISCYYKRHHDYPLISRENYNLYDNHKIDNLLTLRIHIYYIYDLFHETFVHSMHVFYSVILNSKYNGYYTIPRITKGRISFGGTINRHLDGMILPSIFPVTTIGICIMPSIKLLILDGSRLNVFHYSLFVIKPNWVNLVSKL